MMNLELMCKGIAACLIFNGINIMFMRDVIREILVGNRNRKSERKIYKEQSIKQKFLLQYIGPELKKYKKDYTKWLKRYYANLTIVIPEILILALVFALEKEKLFIGLCICFVVCKAVFLAFLRITVYPHGTAAIYAEKPKK